MKLTVRTRRWLPVFHRPRNRESILLYSGSSPGEYHRVVFHRHHGNDRPHVHLHAQLHERSNDGHHAAGHHHHPHSHPSANEHEGGPDRSAGHWHFEADAAPSHPFQILSLKYVVIACESFAQAKRTERVVDHPARPPPDTLFDS